MKLFKVAQFVNSYKICKCESKNYRRKSKIFIIGSNRDVRVNWLVFKRKGRKFMRKEKMKSSNINRDEEFRMYLRLKKQLCAGILAITSAVMLWSGCGVQAFAAEQTTTAEEDENTYTKRYDDLRDILQNGGLGVAVPQTRGVATLASTYDSELLESRIVEGIQAFSTSIDVSDTGLTTTDIDNDVVKYVLNSHPELISITGGYYYYTSGDKVTKLIFSYNSSAKDDQTKLQEAIDEVDSKVDISGMTDEEIVLAYHEYLTSSVAYAYEAYLSGSLGGKHEYDMYGALVNHSAVCQGYAETMFYFLRKAGLPCAIASSKNINHAWNIVKLNGKWYHIDATWDDPVWDMPGRSLHTYFLVSFDTMNKNTLTNHTKDRTDMVVSAQWGDTYTSATDTTYESGKFWNGISKVLYYRGGYWYSIGEGSSSQNYQINKYSYSTKNSQVLYSGSAKWMVSSNSYYPGQYGSIYVRGSSLYFSTPESINRIDLSTSTIKATEIVNIRSNYTTGYNIYAFGEQYGELVYYVSATPNFEIEQDSTDSTKYTKNYDEYTVDMCTSHIWNEGEVITEPTYKTAGTKKFTCKNCDETRTEEIPKLECTSHVWDNGEVITKPTYKAEGTKKYICQNCGATKNDTIAKIVCTSHRWDNGTVTKKATYTAAGIRKYTCKNCGATKQTSIAKLNLTKVTVKSAQQAGAIKLTWNRSAGASGYKIYRRTAKGRYACIKTVKSGTISYVDKTVKSGNRYYYCVKAYNGNVLSGYTETSILYIKAPVVTVSKSAQGVKLSWKKSAGAKKYIVYRKTPTGKYKAVKTVTAKTLSWTDKTAKKGQTYYYIVKAVNNKTYSAASPQKRIKR